ncbi:MAG: biliverdin-producing heme oxygenase [Chloroflexaceae bacterium]|nr:biliverdin-producing heme oxygenase [Chloroflexaceae bacterium]
MNAMTALKIATQTHHSLLEANPHMHKLMSDRLTHTDYVSLLSRMYGFYVPLETCLSQFEPSWQQCGIEFNHRRKVPLLEQDLLAGGLTLDALHQLPHCTSIPRMQSFPQAVGVLYVLEGATLGGQMISRQIALQLGLHLEREVAFFSSYRSKTGAMWKQLSVQINSYAETAFSHTDMATMLLSAQATFQTLDDWLGSNRLTRIAV